MTPTSSPGSQLKARQRGQILARALLFVPALGLLAFTLWQRAEKPAASEAHLEPSAPMRTGEVASIDGWEGLVAREGAAPLRLRLEPLHPEAGRQAFDAQALIAALRSSATPPASAGQKPSEPWRLTLSVAARPGAAADAASEPAVVVETLGGVRIDGLEPLVPPLSQGSSNEVSASELEAVEGPADPLLTLMKFPDAPLRVGQSCDLIFWGPRPEGPVRAVVPGIGDVELLHKVRAAGRSTVSIARLDARSKSPAGEGAGR